MTPILLVCSKNVLDDASLPDQSIIGLAWTSRAPNHTNGKGNCGIVTTIGSIGLQEASRTYFVHQGSIAVNTSYGQPIIFPTQIVNYLHSASLKFSNYSSISSPFVASASFRTLNCLVHSCAFAITFSLLFPLGSTCCSQVAHLLNHFSACCGFSPLTLVLRSKISRTAVGSVSLPGTPISRSRSWLHKSPFFGHAANRLSYIVRPRSASPLGDRNSRAAKRLMIVW